MPTLTITHEAPLELVRQHPALAVELLRAMTGLALPDAVDARLGPTSLNSVVPTEFRADAVVIAADAAGQPLMVIVIEPQGRDDETKVFAWPAYLANVRSAVKCKSAVLIVVCPDPREAEKCREVIAMGHPGWDLWPIVIDPRHAPAADDASPYLTLFLACLPALDLETEEGALRVLAAIRDTGASVADRKALTAIILKRATDAARQILEDLMATAEWKSDFIESYVNVGIEQGREEGREEGLAQGVISGKAGAIVKVLDVRQLQPTAEQLALVTACADLGQLDRWFERSLTAATAAEVFRD
jgi:hypothetical protein